MVKYQQILTGNKSISMVINEIYTIQPGNITEVIEGFVEYKNELDQHERLRNREGWNTKAKPFCPQKFKRKIYWHRIRSRCF